MYKQLQKTRFFASDELVPLFFFIKVMRKTIQNKVWVVAATSSLTLSSSFFHCLFIQLLILHSLSSISTYTHILLQCSCYERWLSSVLISHSKRIFIYTTNDVVVNVRFFHCCCSLSPSSFLVMLIPTYLLWFVQEKKKKKYNKSAQRVDKLFFILSKCVCSSSYEYAFFSLHIINFPLLYFTL